MPTTCRDASGRTIDAELMDEAAWDALKATYTTRGLVMPCCGADAIPKTSPLGNPFFAHRGRECDAVFREPETPEHRRLKRLVAETVRGVGWTAVEEFASETPDGAAWRADVMVERHGIRAAIEVQLAPQTGADTELRTARYAASGMPCFWLFAREPRRLHLVPVTEIAPAAWRRQVPGVEIHNDRSVRDCVRIFLRKLLEIRRWQVEHERTVAGLRADLAAMMAAMTARSETEGWTVTRNPASTKGPRYRADVEVFVQRPGAAKPVPLLLRHQFPEEHGDSDWVLLAKGGRRAELRPFEDEYHQGEDELPPEGTPEQARAELAGAAAEALVHFVNSEPD